VVTTEPHAFASPASSVDDALASGSIVATSSQTEAQFGSPTGAITTPSQLCATEQLPETSVVQLLLAPIDRHVLHVTEPNPPRASSHEQLRPFQPLCACRHD
jgi:hypothetical protein